MSKIKTNVGQPRQETIPTGSPLGEMPLPIWIEELKQEGIKVKLSAAMKDKLWRAHKACDEASQESLENYEVKIALVNQLLAETAQIWVELQRI